MKKTIAKLIQEKSKISADEAVNDFFNGDYNLRDWDETLSWIDDYFEYDFDEISEEEKKLVKELIKAEFDVRVADCRQEEIDQLKDRESILAFLDDRICPEDGYYEEGDVGFVLSKEEILDLILKNGNKIIFI